MAVVVEELIPAPEPMDVARKLAHLPHLLFLDSADRHPERGRYSYVMADPVEFRTDVDFRDLEEWIREYSCNTLAGLPPFQGGIAGLFGYGLGRQLESIPAPHRDEFAVSDLALGLYPWVVAFDHVTDRVWMIANRISSERITQIRKILNEYSLLEFGHQPVFVTLSNAPKRADARTPTQCETAFPLLDHPNVFSNFSRRDYQAAVRRAVEYVHAGDVFQVNISQRLLAPQTEHPFELYSRLREVSPAPFAAYFDAGDFQIASASPERFLQLSPDRRVSTKPIKGTRPRGKTNAEDDALLKDLTTSSKDRAENIMIVDLLRNDLGRVCEYGSVKVPRVCEVESYRDVHHLVSEVVGQLRPGLTAFDLLKAAFPGGSVTGAPKVRAMEIIAELEPTARGPYCGSLGWIGFDGAMDTNILIRTFTASGGWLQFPVGGGVVADSTPEREYEETLHKAAGLLRALRRQP